MAEGRKREGRGEKGRREKGRGKKRKGKGGRRKRGVRKGEKDERGRGGRDGEVRLCFLGSSPLPSGMGTGVPSWLLWGPAQPWGVGSKAEAVLLPCSPRTGRWFWFVWFWPHLPMPRELIKPGRQAAYLDRPSQRLSSPNPCCCLFGADAPAHVGQSASQRKLKHRPPLAWPFSLCVELHAMP